MTKCVTKGLASDITVEQQVAGIIQTLNEFQKLHHSKSESDLIENIKKQFVNFINSEN